MELKDLNAFSDFHVAPISERACVGENTGIDASERDLSIFDGFCEAVDLLYSNLKDTYADIIVYPFMYCCRHAFELILKYNLRQLCDLEAIKQKCDASNIIQSHKNVFNQHALKLLVNDVKSLLSLDRRLQNEFSAWFQDDIDKLLEEFYEDEKSDTYRYTYDLDGNEHFADKGLVALGIVYKKFQAVKTQLEGFNKLIAQLIQEYRLGIFTKNLSRADIKTIAEQLPTVEHWAENSFDTVRNGICQTYGISRNELSTCIKIIKKHREFCSKIGLELRFGELTFPTMKKVATISELFAEKHHTNAESVIDFSQIPDKENEYKQAYKIASTISLNEQTLILSFIELGKMNYYSENLDVIYKHHKDRGRNDGYFIGKCKVAYQYLKSAFIKSGQLTYFEALEKAYTKS